METWISGDHHFGHANVIKYCNRPYVNVTEMDNELISIWNSYVAPKDIVYYLGDFTLGNEELAFYYFACLNGIIFVLGNKWHHDKRWLQRYNVPDVTEYDTRSKVSVRIVLPVEVMEDVMMNEDGNGIPAILCHYQFLNWDRQHYGSLHFFGHSHGTSEPRHNCLDVGIDNAFKLVGEYRPLRLDEACKFASNIP